MPLQLDPALLQVLSEREIAAERELAEWIRAQRRKQRRREIEAELAADRRDRKSAAALRRSEEADARWHRRALAARRRVSSEDARLAQLYRRAEWSSRALIAVVVLGMVWAGVNVQHNLVPSGDMSDPLYWLSYGIEAMISIPIITIMVAATTAARWGRELARGKVIFFEAALLGTTVALNTGPHLAAGDLGRAAEYAIAPVMVGVVIWLHAWVSARYAVLIDGAPVIDRDAQPVRIGTDRVAEMAAGDRPRPLDGGNSVAHHEFGGDTADHAAHSDGDLELERHAAHTDSSPNPCNVGSRSAHGHPVGRSVAEPYAVREMSTTSQQRPVDGHAITSSWNGHVFPLTNGHGIETTINGHDLSDNHAAVPIKDESDDGNAGDQRVNGHSLHPTANEHAVADPATGAALNLRNGHTVRPNANGSSSDNFTARDAHSAQRDDQANPPPTNGHEFAGAANPAQRNGHGDQPVRNGHASGFSPDVSKPDPRVDGHTTPPADHPVSAVADYVFELPAHERTARTADAAAQVPSGAAVGQQNQAGAASSVHLDNTVEGTPDPTASTRQPSSEPAPTSAARQISLDDLHDGLEFDEHLPAPPNSEHGPESHTVRQHSYPGHGGSPIDRAPRGNDAGPHPSGTTTDPVRTSASAATDAAAQAHPNATAPRAAKRGKSLPAERNDRSADPEGEQLALEEATEVSRPEPMPVLDVDEDEGLPAEPEEADTDDDEISAIARAITTRRLSSLPIEEVREILTLADQGGSTPAIANELGVSRAAVTRVLDSAIRVHRPYAVIG
ncbi:hypothetical protein ACRS6B_03285 [Nocardia asteroides]